MAILGGVLLVIAGPPLVGVVHQGLAAPRYRNANMQDPYADYRHTIYSPAWVIDAIDRLAALNKEEGGIDQNRSQLITNAMKKILRANAVRLREAGVELPDELFRETRGKTAAAE